ncbi:MAG: hypothetical protein ACYSTL_06825, partial [Planctomycetota bacterium]
IQRFSDQKLPVAQAHLGLGKIAEAQGLFDLAREQYQIVLNNEALAGYPVVKMAEGSLDHLSDLTQQVRMATTAPSTQPATDPASAAPAS